MLRHALLVLFSAVAPLFAQQVGPTGKTFPKLALPQLSRSAGIIDALGSRVPEVAQFYNMSEQQFRAVVERDRSLLADQSGHLIYACAGLMVPDEMAEAPVIDPQPIVYPPEQTFLLHSRPAAVRKIYLDFNGHTTSNTPWNTNINNGNAFTTPPYDIDGNPGGFNSNELSRIQEIWKRVAEDFAPYEVDVTTEDPGLDALRKSNNADQAYGIRVCIGGSSYDWYKRGAGGVAYIGSFNWNSDTPCYTFTAQLGNGHEKYTAEATSHEIGHTLGLLHDGQTNGTEYYSGHGTWAPIMGVGYDRPIVQFSKGEYAQANNTQDDTAVMQLYGAPLRLDDAGGGVLSAVALDEITPSVKGVISTRDDRDFFSFNTKAGPISFSTTAPSASPNVHVKLSLYDVDGVLVAESAPSGALMTTLEVTVAAGTYYIAVEGTAPGDPVANYNDYGSLGEYELEGIIQSGAENFVSVVATDPDAAETAAFTEKPNPGVFTFRRLLVTNDPLQVPFTIGGTASLGSDYAMPTTVTIPARAASTTLTVSPVDDQIGDGTKTVILTLSPSANYTLSNAKKATVSIRDNELPKVDVLAPTPEILENSASPGKFTVHRNAKAATPLTVNLLVSGSAEAETDYTPFPTSVTFAPGEDKREVSLFPLDNGVYNLPKTVTVTVATHLEYGPGFQTSATIRLLNDEPPPDPAKPTVAISSPKAKQRFNHPVATLVATGIAKDNLGVARVEFRLNGAAQWENATLNGTAWTAEIAGFLRPGNNLLEARSFDADENVSPVAAVTFAVVKPCNLEIVVSGPGTVSPGAGTFVFEANQTYTLKAKPNAGKVFAGWTGASTASAKTLSFVMPDGDAAITATFVDNPFGVGIAGKYEGLLRGADASPETAGLLSLTVTSKGMATGKLWLHGKAFPVKGEFSGLGQMRVELAPRKQPKIIVALTLDLNPNGTQAITGTITGPEGPSTVLARRAPFDARKNPLSSEFARSYTFFLPPLAAPAAGASPVESSLPDGEDSAPRPQGYGVGTVTISTAGVVKWTGTLNDGSTVTQSTVLDAQKRWPLYVPLYKGAGYASAEVQHDPAQAGSDLTAGLTWVKPASPTERFFPGGVLAEDHPLTGVNYTPPAKGQRVLPSYDAAANNAGPFTLQAGNLGGAGLAGTLTLLPNNAFSLVSPVEKLKLAVNAKTGAVTGSFVFPITRAVTPIKGVILQGKIGKGVGFFPGSTPDGNSVQTGRLDFNPATP